MKIQIKDGNFTPPEKDRTDIKFRDFISTIKIEYKLNCSSKSFLFNLLYPNYCYKYLFSLRLYEFVRCKRGLYKVLSPFLKYRVHRLSYKTKIEIPLFTVGYGLKINHTTGGIVVNSRARIGRYCCLSNGVIIGQDNIYKPNNVPTIGDNVHFAPNAKVFGKVSIGNNVIIGTDTIIMKSVPDNCSVVGNPARIVRQNGVKCNITL